MPPSGRALLWCGFSFGLGVAATLLVAPRFAKNSTAKADSPPLPSPTLEGARHRQPVPPWGKLVFARLPLGKSDEIFVDKEKRLRKTEWIFEHFSKTQLEDLLRASALTDSQWTMLQATGVVNAYSNGMMISPPDEFVWTLTGFSREQIYSVLASNSANYAQCFPFRFRLGGFEDRMETSELPPALFAKLKGLTYTNSLSLCLADLQVLPDVLTSNEFNQVVECLYRIPAYRLRLVVTPDSDINALVAYWGRGGREKFIRPFLESVAEAPNNPPISVSTLMPPTARLHLYTFPSAWPNGEADREDCFWTALNFFRDPPDERFLDSAFNRQFLQKEYIIVTGQRQFGDVVALVDANGNAIHACVHIADDFVFTKNGENNLQPWVIMRMSDMLTSFLVSRPERVVVFRPKGGPSSHRNLEPGERGRFANHATGTSPHAWLD